MFSDAQLKLIAETLANIGIVFFGSTVVPTIVGAQTEITILTAGLALAVSFWITGVVVLKNIRL